MGGSDILRPIIILGGQSQLAIESLLTGVFSDHTSLTHSVLQSPGPDCVTACRSSEFPPVHILISFRGVVTQRSGNTYQFRPWWHCPGSWTILEDRMTVIAECWHSATLLCLRSSFFDQAIGSLSSNGCCIVETEVSTWCMSSRTHLSAHFVPEGEVQPSAVE